MKRIYTLFGSAHFKSDNDLINQLNDMVRSIWKDTIFGRPPQEAQILLNDIDKNMGEKGTIVRVVIEDSVELFDIDKLVENSALATAENNGVLQFNVEVTNGLITDVLWVD